MPAVLPSVTAPLDCFAIVAPGLEALALREAQSAGLAAREEEGGFAWSGDFESVMLANIVLRIPSRIVVRLASFEARSFAELERRARRIEWGRVLRNGDSVRFRVTSRKSKLYHTGGIAQRLGDSIIRAMPRVTVGVGAPEDDADDHQAQIIIVRFVRDHCVISADTSGDLLHKRGYRQATAKAPLRETIAAAMIQASEWTFGTPLVDPFCGAGTIPIEAATLALGRAPGAQRRFAVERWPGVAPALLKAVGDRVSGAARAAVPAIRGSDRDAGAIAAAVANATRAEVADAITFAEHSISDAEFGPAPGWVISNPPYGVRVGDADRVRDLWGRFGRVLRERAAGWRVVLLSPDQVLDRQLGFPMQVLASTSNGGIPVRIISGMA